MSGPDETVFTVSVADTMIVSPISAVPAAANVVCSVLLTSVSIALNVTFVSVSFTRVFVSADELPAESVAVATKVNVPSGNELTFTVLVKLPAVTGAVAFMNAAPFEILSAMSPTESATVPETVIALAVAVEIGAVIVVIAIEGAVLSNVPISEAVAWFPALSLEVASNVRSPPVNDETLMVADHVPPVTVAFTSDVEEAAESVAFSFTVVPGSVVPVTFTFEAAAEPIGLGVIGSIVKGAGATASFVVVREAVLLSPNARSSVTVAVAVNAPSSSAGERSETLKVCVNEPLASVFPAGAEIVFVPSLTVTVIGRVLHAFPPTVKVDDAWR